MMANRDRSLRFLLTRVLLFAAAFAIGIALSQATRSDGAAPAQPAIGESACCAAPKLFVPPLA